MEAFFHYENRPQFYVRHYAPGSYDLNHIALAPSNIQFVASDVVET
jgi:hypothetical protein